MHYYFTSAYPCALKINGIFKDKLDNSKIEYDSHDNHFPLIEACPLTQTERLKCFILNDEFLLDPPPNVQVTDLKGGYLIHFEKSYIYGQFEIKAKYKSNDLAVTVYFENGLKISIETPTDFKVVNVYYDATNVEIEKVTISKVQLLNVRFIGKKNLFILFTYYPTIEQVFYREIDGFSFLENLTTIEKVPDILKHNVKSVWELKKDKFIEKERIVTANKNIDTLSLINEIVPYVFCESYLLGGNYLNFLSDQVKVNAHALKDYLGEFIGVMPPPKFRNEDEVGLIKKRNNRYEIDYFNFSLENGKICNIKKSAD